MLFLQQGVSKEVFWKLTNVSREELQQYFYLNREIGFMSVEVKELEKRYRKTPKSNISKNTMVSAKAQEERS